MPDMSDSVMEHSGGMQPPANKKKKKKKKAQQKPDDDEERRKKKSDHREHSEVMESAPQKRKKRERQDMDNERSTVGWEKSENEENPEDVEPPLQKQKKKRQKLDDAWYEERCSIVRTQGSDSSEEQFQCRQCKYIGATRRRFYKHWEQTHDKGLECDQCTFKTASRKALEKHRLLNHDASLEDRLKLKKIALRYDRILTNNTTVYQCKSCGAQYPRIGKFEYHWNIAHEEPLQCSFCNYTTPIKATLKRHLSLKHLKIKDNRCDLCNFAFAEPRQLRKHYKLSHGLGEEAVLEKNNMKKELHGQKVIYRCMLCDFVSTTEIGVYKHKGSMHRRRTQEELMFLKIAAEAEGRNIDQELKDAEEKKDNPFEKGNFTLVGDRYKCNKCKYEGKSSQLYFKHWKSSHSQSLKCDHCTYVTGQIEHFKWHMATHLVVSNQSRRTVHPQKKEKAQFPCKYCDKKYASKEKYRSHRSRKHKKIACPKCEFKTRVPDRLADHRKATHKKAKDKKCPDCDFATSKQVKLDKHRNEQHKKIKKRCDQCGFKTSNELKLDKHRRRHLKELGLVMEDGERFRCASCAFMSLSMVRVRQHRGKMHRAEEASASGAGARPKSKIVKSAKNNVAKSDQKERKHEDTSGAGEKTEGPKDPESKVIAHSDSKKVKPAKNGVAGSDQKRAKTRKREE